jgi:hypothetical protein
MITKSVEAPIWAILISAFGLVVGLATYGYKVTRAMGVRLSKLSPTRGFCAELSTAMVIMIASQVSPAALCSCCAVWCGVCSWRAVLMLCRRTVLPAHAALCPDHHVAPPLLLSCSTVYQPPPLSASLVASWVWACARAKWVSIGELA